MSPFQQVNYIMDFTSRKEIPITEDHVREHIDYFRDLVE